MDLELGDHAKQVGVLGAHMERANIGSVLCWNLSYTFDLVEDKCCLQENK
jgi:hypothetical protein